MDSLSITVPLTLLISGSAYGLLKAVYLLWQLDRRVVVVETKLDIIGEKNVAHR